MPGMFLNLTRITQENEELHFSEVFSEVHGQDGNLATWFCTRGNSFGAESLDKLLSVFPFTIKNKI
jgi:hypothetical protein